MRRSRLAGDEGFTLIELMIAVSILGIIIVPIVSSFLLGLLESTSSRERVADSSAAQVISTYLMSDVQSSCLRPDPDHPCGPGTIVKDPASAACATAGDVKLELAWKDPSTGETFVADYVDTVDADGEHQLRRAFCTNSGAPENTLLALNLQTSAFDTECEPVACPTDPITVVELPTRVKVHITAESTAPSDKSSYAPFEFTFDATRRAATWSN